MSAPPPRIIPHDVEKSGPQQTMESHVHDDDTDGARMKEAIHGEEKALPSSSSDDDPPGFVAQDTDPDTDAGHGAGAEASGIVGRVLSRATSRSSIAQGPPPDGGVTAWMASTLLCAMKSDLMRLTPKNSLQRPSGHYEYLVSQSNHHKWMPQLTNLRGIVNSFGVFQSYYTTLLGRPPSDIAWIGSFEVFLLFFISTFSGRLTDAGYFRHLFIAGFLFVFLGMFATSFCSQYWQLFLSQGICLGLGNGLLFCPALSTASTYFDKKRALALGFVSIGSSTGGLIYPSMVRQLLPSIGFGWTIRAIAFVQAGTLVISFIFLKPRVKPRKAGSIVEWAAFKELEYTFYAIGSFLVSSL